MLEDLRFSISRIRLRMNTRTQKKRLNVALICSQATEQAMSVLKPSTAAIKPNSLQIYPFTHNGGQILTLSRALEKIWYL